MGIAFALEKEGKLYSPARDIKYIFRFMVKGALEVTGKALPEEDMEDLSKFAVALAEMMNNAKNVEKGDVLDVMLEFFHTIPDKLEGRPIVLFALNFLFAACLRYVSGCRESAEDDILTEAEFEKAVKQTLLFRGLPREMVNEVKAELEASGKWVDSVMDLKGLFRAVEVPPRDPEAEKRILTELERRASELGISVDEYLKRLRQDAESRE